MSSSLSEGKVPFLHVPSLSDKGEGSYDKSSTKSKNFSVFIRGSLLSSVDGGASEGILFVLDKLVHWVGSLPTVTSMGTRSSGSSDIFGSINWSVEMAVGGAILPCCISLT